ncbi:type II toxin-antitoxin system Phd/YefM family antitoxin [Aeoliella sp. SH292]|uniref:type II toxin-antitoxin system Phd/YefM family antitoxin n=1 Tax=Aeoliella sp. SH292 TaxID=3454464 RepID=UPI003F9684A0
MARTEWSIAEAKSRLSEVLNQAEVEAQIITRRHRKFVLLSGSEYSQLVGNQRSLKDLILSGPTLENVELERDRSVGREALL